MKSVNMDKFGISTMPNKINEILQNAKNIEMVPWKHENWLSIRQNRFES